MAFATAQYALSVSTRLVPKETTLDEPQRTHLVQLRQAAFSMATDQMDVQQMLSQFSHVFSWLACSSSSVFSRPCASRGRKWVTSCMLAQVVHQP